MAQRPAPHPLRYIRQLVERSPELEVIGFPRRTLAALLAFTFLLAPFGITPAIFPVWLWDVLYTVTGLVMVGLALGLHDKVAARALGAFLAGLTTGARTIALLIPFVLVRIDVTPSLILGLAVWPTLGAFAVALLAFWHRLA